ncbi:MAG TPA: glycosyltransferase family 4 protein [Chitinophagaceae bacterium]|nr:glycosyltransferase family 4 protein [Chitinophagaceae bacterium]
MVTYFYDDNLSTEDEMLRQYYTITGWAEALQRAGQEVIVISRFSKESRVERNNVVYHFIKDSLGGHFKSWQFPVKFLKKVAALDADLVHLHHLTLSIQTIFLRRILKNKTAIIIQHHGGKIIPSLKLSLHNFLNRIADGYFFTTVEQGESWFNNKVRREKLMPVMEGGTFFNFETRDEGGDSAYMQRTIAKQKTGMQGSPVFLWVGRLDNNKDPLTILDGFEVIFQEYPSASLYMIYRDYDLLEKVRGKTASSAILKASVHLLGAIAHTEIKYYYNSADYFVLGSHYEGSGYALSEALRCGCIPIVTDIPSFRMMTNNGQLGALWQTGNKKSFIEAVSATLEKPLLKESNDCIEFFEKTLSFDAIAKQALQYYQQAIQSRLNKNSA